MIISNPEFTQFLQIKSSSLIVLGIPFPGLDMFLVLKNFFTNVLINFTSPAEPQTPRRGKCCEHFTVSSFWHLSKNFWVNFMPFK